MKTNSTRHGFTRTELVVALVVVRVLAAFGISYIKDAMRQEFTFGIQRSPNTAISFATSSSLVR